jgi:hypothetical protein
VVINGADTEIIVAGGSDFAVVPSVPGLSGLSVGVLFFPSLSESCDEEEEDDEDDDPEEDTEESEDDEELELEEDDVDEEEESDEEDDEDESLSLSDEEDEEDSLSSLLFLFFWFWAAAVFDFFLLAAAVALACLVAAEVVASPSFFFFLAVALFGSGCRSILFVLNLIFGAGLDSKNAAISCGGCRMIWLTRRSILTGSSSSCSMRARIKDLIPSIMTSSLYSFRICFSSGLVHQ